MMPHKQECMCYCIDHLQSRNLQHVFDKSVFEHYYRKFKCAFGNAYLIGLKSADMMINEASQKQVEPLKKEVYAEAS